MYREQVYIERCHCGAPATTACVACGRARCAPHVANGLCNRCLQAITRELELRSGGRWVTAGVTGAATALLLMIMQLTMIAIVGLPVGIAVFFGLRVYQREMLVQQMGPALAASKGEVPRD